MNLRRFSAETETFDEQPGVLTIIMGSVKAEGTETREK